MRRKNIRFTRTLSILSTLLIQNSYSTGEKASEVLSKSKNIQNKKSQSLIHFVVGDKTVNIKNLRKISLDSIQEESIQLYINGQQVDESFKLENLDTIIQQKTFEILLNFYFKDNEFIDFNIKLFS